jgi:uncharacterized SAM-binding protein YcdF (DUF218 family)
MSTREILEESRKGAERGARFRIALASLGLIFIAGVIMFRQAGRWLIREDPLAKADVIVVLSGSMPFRAEEAARIFLMGYAPEVWLSRPEAASAALETFGIAYVGEESYNRDILIHLGVPAGAIKIFPEAIVNTEEEIEEVSQEMGALSKRDAIIVTSPPHTRRVRTLWRRLADDHLHMTVDAAWQDPFDPDHWWRSTRDASAVAREMMGLLNAWAGLPVRPHAPREPNHSELPAHL